MSIAAILQRAGVWFLESGIQEPEGGVARYYRKDLGENAAISTEITGYGVSTLLYLHSIAPEPRFERAAIRAGQYLTRQVWNRPLCAMPFEPGSTHLYFFDYGMIARGLLQLWRHTRDREYLDTATGCGLAMYRDFPDGSGDFHPILELPAKTPLPREPRWSREPGCYQLKSALAWDGLSAETAGTGFLEAYSATLERALCTHGQFLPGAVENERLMDRLHPFCYFLEGILPRLDDPRCADALRRGVDTAAGYLRAVAPQFERSDVYAALLRLRLFADAAGVAPVDRLAAEWEANRLMDFAISSFDNRVHGGFYFGRRQGEFLPHVNPVSTGFALQALAMWRDYQTGKFRPDHAALI